MLRNDDDGQRLVHASRAPSLDQDAREPRIHRQRGHLPAESRDAPLAIHRAEFLQQSIAVVEQARVGRVEKRELLRTAEAECSHLQHQAREVRAQQFGLGVAWPREVVVLGIEPDADALAFAAATAATLVRTRLRHGLDRQPLELGARTVAADARETGIDDEPHARNGERRFRDVRREHDAAPRMPGKHLVLLRPREPAVQRQHVPVDAAAHQQVARFEDLLFAGQEDERVPAQATRIALEFLECVAHCLRQRRRRLVFLGQRPVTHLDRITLPFDVDDRRTAEKLGESLRLDRRGRDDEPQVRPLRQQPVADAEQEVDVEVALVRLVDDQRVVAQQQRVALDLAQQQAVRHQLDQRARAGAIDESDLVTDEVARGRTEFGADAVGQRLRSNAPRLRMADQARGAPPHFEADLRQLRALAAARGAADDHDLVRLRSRGGCPRAARARAAFRRRRIGGTEARRAATSSADARTCALEPRQLARIGGGGLARQAIERRLQPAPVAQQAVRQQFTQGRKTRCGGLRAVMAAQPSSRLARTHSASRRSMSTSAGVRPSAASCAST